MWDGFINRARGYGQVAHNPASIGAPAAGNGGGGPPSTAPPGVPHVLNTILALLAVLAVMAAHALYRLVSLPFRLVRGMFRQKARPTPMPAR